MVLFIIIGIIILALTILIIGTLFYFLGYGLGRYLDKSNQSDKL